jgi:protein O-mannosyl-transferase
MKSSRTPKGKVAKRTGTQSKKSGNVVSLQASEIQLIIIFCLVVVVFLCFGNSFGNDFVFDDIYLVLQNKYIRSLDLSIILRTYRPMRDLSYALDLKIWGEGPFGFHLTNILIHSANVLLVFALIRRLSEDVVTATLAALIFAVHPMQTDAVTYISGRRDLLFSFFYLLAFHSYISYYRSRRFAHGAAYFSLFLVLWALSLMSKEMAASLPLVVFVWHYCEGWEEGPSWWRQVATTSWRTFAKDKWFWLLLFLGGLAFTGYWVLIKQASRKARWGEIDYWGGSLLNNVLTVIRVHAWYLKQLVYPTPIAQYLGAFEVSQTVFDWSFALSLLVVGGVVVCGFLLLNRDRLMAFAIFSYFVLLLPVSQIIPHHELLADHYLYLPMMSFGLFVALLVRRIKRFSPVAGKVAYLAAGLAIVILAVMTIMHNRAWKNERTLWTSNYKAVPNSPRAALNLGNTYQDTEPEKAEELFKRALGLNPTPETKRTLTDRLAVVLINQKKFDEAEYYVADVLSRSPNDFFGNLWASEIYMFRKECDKADQALSLAQSVAAKEREVQLAEQARLRLKQQCWK